MGPRKLRFCKYWLGAICLTLALAGCLDAQPQGQAVRSLNGSATNLASVGGMKFTDSSGGNPILFTNDSNTRPEQALTMFFTTGSPIYEPYVFGQQDFHSTVASNVYFGSIFAAGTPGIFASAIPGPGYMGNYTVSGAWDALEALNLGNPYPFNFWFSGSVNGGGDGTTNTVARFGHNVSATGAPVKTDIGTLYVLMEGNEADVDTNHVSTFIVQAEFPDLSSTIPLNISAYIRPGDPLYKKVVFQSQFDNWQMAFDRLPSTNLFNFNLSPGFVQLNYALDGTIFYSNPGGHKIVEFANACDIFYSDSGAGIIEMFHNNPFNGPTLWLGNGGILQTEGGVCIGTNGNPNALNATNQLAVSTPFKKDVLDVATNGTTYSQNLTTLGQLTLNQTTNTPVNTNHAVAWYVITNNGVQYYTPLFQ